jgi:hypothetical protein
VQLMEHLQNRHIPCPNVFRDMLQIVEFGPVQPSDLVCGDFDAMF